MTGRNLVLIPGLPSFLGVPQKSLKSALTQLGAIKVNNTSEESEPKRENGGDHNNTEASEKLNPFCDLNLFLTVTFIESQSFQ